MLTACFDAAGKLEDKNTSVVLVAGFASFDGVWRDFDQEWNAVLKLASVSHFHPLQFAHAKGEFARFRGDERVKRDFASQLMNVIEKSGLRKFGAWVKKADFHQGKAAMNLANDLTVDPFVLCARSCVDDLSRHANGEGSPGVRTIFEKVDPEDLLRKP